MIAKRKRKQSSAQHNMEQAPQWEQHSTAEKQQQNRRLRTDRSLGH